MKAPSRSFWIGMVSCAVLGVLAVVVVYESKLVQDISESTVTETSNNAATTDHSSDRVIVREEVKIFPWRTLLDGLLLDIPSGHTIDPLFGDAGSMPSLSITGHHYLIGMEYAQPGNTAASTSLTLIPLFSAPEWRTCMGEEDSPHSLAFFSGGQQVERFQFPAGVTEEPNEECRRVVATAEEVMLLPLVERMRFSYDRIDVMYRQTIVESYTKPSTRPQITIQTNRRNRQTPLIEVDWQIVSEGAPELHAVSWYMDVTEGITTKTYRELIHYESGSLSGEFTFVLPANNRGGSSYTVEVYALYSDGFSVYQEPVQKFIYD